MIWSQPPAPGEVGACWSGPGAFEQSTGHYLYLCATWRPRSIPSGPASSLLEILNTPALGCPTPGRPASGARTYSRLLLRGRGRLFPLRAGPSSATSRGPDNGPRPCWHRQRSRPPAFCERPVGVRLPREAFATSIRSHEATKPPLNCGPRNRFHRYRSTSRCRYGRHPPQGWPFRRSQPS